MGPLPGGSPLLTALLVAGVLAVAAWLWLRRNRRYTSAASVAQAYDAWTDDRLLERLWGEHVHLGRADADAQHVEAVVAGQDAGAAADAAAHIKQPGAGRQPAKADFVHELVRWGGLDRLPPGSRLLDVGCGIGGSARILARDYGFDVLGISISPAQIARARTLTPPALRERCRFAVMDALALDLPDGAPDGPDGPDGTPGPGFDAVWSVEAGPHMADKQRYADELLRVLRPGGRLVVADWNRRDPSAGPMNGMERRVMRQLLDQWAHPEFASIEGLSRHLEVSPWAGGLVVETDDWTAATVPSWRDSIAEGLRRPGAVLGLGPKAVLQGLRETPTLLLMDWAFRSGLMRFGVFRATRGPENAAQSGDQSAGSSSARLSSG